MTEAVIVGCAMPEGKGLQTSFSDHLQQIQLRDV